MDLNSNSSDGYHTVKVYDNSSVEYSPVEHNLDYVKNLVYQRENPNPTTIIFLVLGVIILLFFMYTLFIKRNISGIWFGGNGEDQSSIKYKVVHNPFTDSLTITGIDGKVIKGKVSGHTIWIFRDNRPDLIGVMLSKNKILWVQANELWHNVKVLN